MRLGEFVHYLTILYQFHQLNILNNMSVRLVLGSNDIFEHDGCLLFKMSGEFIDFSECMCGDLDLKVSEHEFASVDRESEKGLRD